MTNKTLLLSTGLYLSCMVLSAQTYHGKLADQHFPGAQTIRLATGQSQPQYVRLATDTYVREANLRLFFQNKRFTTESEQLRLVTTEKDQLGITHHRYQQYVHDHPVIGSYYLAHCQAGWLRSFNGELYDLPQSPPRPQFLPAAAVDKALLMVPSELYAWDCSYGDEEQPISPRPRAELVWVPTDLDFERKDFRLAYEVTVHSLRPLKKARLYLDAQTAQLVAQENLLHETDTLGTAHTVLSGQRTITTELGADSLFRLRENTRNIQTLNMNQGNNYDLAEDFTDEDNDWNNVNEELDQYATDAHWATAVYHELLASKGRNSIDNHGHPLTVCMHYDHQFGNAFWNGSVATFGDGDSLGPLDRPLTTIDIVGHEFTHGLIQHTANLIYNGESGALNESFADIFGFATNLFGRGPTFMSWRMAAEATSSGEGIRSFQTPNLFEDPETYEGDLWFSDGGVHTNSGVQNHWFYLLAQGETDTNELGFSYAIDGIGWQRAFDIAYRNLTIYLGPTSNYEDAAFYGSLSAADLFGACSEAYQNCVLAWQAVNLGSDISNSPAADFTYQGNRCESPATLQFINTSSLYQSASWDFGDGNSSTETAPSHTYAAPGNYLVTLDIVPCGPDSNTVLSSEQYLSIDPLSALCDTTIMPTDGTLTLTECAGVILDPGGNGPYENNTNSTLHLLPAAGQVSLYFPLFSVEGWFDNLAIYDGPDSNSPMIGLYDADELQGETITSTHNALTLVFQSDGVVTYEGFVIEFTTQGSDLPVVAGFTTSASSYLVNQPVYLTNTSDNSIVHYDFGDGTLPTDAANPVHHYSASGTYTIEQVVSNCSLTDTASVTITIAETGNLTVFPDDLCVTLPAGQDTLLPIHLYNSGPGAVYYAPMLHQEQMEVSSSSHFGLTGITTHTLEVPTNNIENGLLTITINGDFDDTNEFATLYLEGQLIENIGQFSGTTNGTDIVRTLELSGEELATWLVDGQLAVEIVNSSSVDLNLGGSDHHTAQLTVYYSSFASLSPVDSIATVGDTTTIDTYISAVDLNDGIYTTDLHLSTGDTSQHIVTIPTKLIVEGEPVLRLTPLSLDFDTLFLGQTRTEKIYLSNDGTDTLVVDSIAFQQTALFSLTPTNFTLLPGENDSLCVSFHPPTVGTYQDVLHFYGNVPLDSVTVLGSSLAPPVADLSVDEICVTLTTDSLYTDTFYVNNLGVGELAWEFQRPLQVLLVNGGVTEGVAYENLMAAFGTINANFLELTEISSAAFTAVMDDVDLIVFPTQAEASPTDYSNLAAPIQQYLSTGGKIILLHDNGGRASRNTGLFPTNSLFDVTYEGLTSTQID
ncbi:MAG: M4 family metallopeptidase, partial [Bacteroidota bacterium]